MRRSHRLFTLGATAALVAACGVIPANPSPLPSDYVPTTPSASAAPLGNLSPDGFSAAQRMTVRVRNVGCTSPKNGTPFVIKTGTGFAVDAHTLVTNRHVIEDTKELQVTTYDGRTIDVTAASATAVADLAIITTEQSIGGFAALAQADPLEGDAITVIGYPGGGKPTTVTGVVLGSVADPLGAALGTVMATTASVEPGSSGSPVLNEKGEVVGVIYAKNESEQSFMVPVSLLRTLIAEDQLLVTQANTCGKA